MFSYYTVIIYLCVFSMLIMQLCISTSNTLKRRTKILFRILFLNIIMAALCEWVGVYLQGTGESTRILHILIKAIELSIAPSIGFTTAWIIDDRRTRGAILFLVGNSLIEILSGFYGFVYYVDEKSNYHHGDFYWIYVAAYVISILYCMYIVSKNLKRYQYNGNSYFLLMVIFMLGGITTQLCDWELRVDYITLAIASI